MNNIDLIDDYLTNRLTESQREAFEQQLNADPTLKTDVEFQRQVIDGLKKSRVAELKSMLNNFPVSPVRDFTTLKVAAGIVGGALLIGTVYFYNNGEQGQPIITEPKDSITVITESELSPSDDENEVISVNTEAEELKTESKSDVKEPATTIKKEATKPTLQVVDPSSELVESTSSPVNHGVVSATPPAVEVTSLQVDIDSASKKYKFHYQFTEGKVVLYGSFDRSLYEIIELNGGKHSVYLYYQNKYYFLNEQSIGITPLDTITDKAIISKLETYRKK